MANQKAVVQEAGALWNAHDLDRYFAHYTPNFVIHGIAPEPQGIEGTRAFYEALFAAYPDAKIAVNTVIEEGDKVAEHFTFRGTHKGEFMGVPASGRSVKMDAITIFRFEGSKVVERWMRGDMLAVMQQIGAIPAAPTA